jgi:uncharacterized protein YndB with AHSA1/START domain
MAQTSDTATAVQPAPLRISRRFPAPRELAFKAWSSAGHVKRWFCPAGYTIPQANVHMHVGGPFEVCMRAPDGVEHWTRGTFSEIAAPRRLVLDLKVSDAAGRFLFRALTEVSFFDEEGATRMDVVQTYAFEDPAQAGPMVKGAPVGWSQTLDKLEAELVGMQRPEAAARSVVHATFSLERTYDAPVARVFTALSDEAAKSKWFSGSDGQWRAIERRMDFRVGGRELLKGRWQGGAVTVFDAVYLDIVPLERIVYAYDMFQDDRKLSVSLATMELRPAGPTRTTLVVTEQGAFLDGYDDAGSREHGTDFLLDRLGASLLN